jgi:hypothetical protein
MWEPNYIKVEFYKKVMEQLKEERKNDPPE